MSLTTKNDLVIAALRKLGIASDATLTDVEPQSNEDAVTDLELMMAEWLGDGKGIDVGYQFASEDAPDDSHGMELYALSAVILNLACRIAPDYGREASAKLVMGARYGKEQLVKLTAESRARKAKSGYPSRMPIGTGNRCVTRHGWNFFPGKKEGE